MAIKTEPGNIAMDSLDGEKRAEIEALINSQYVPETPADGGDTMASDADGPVNGAADSVGDSASAPWRERDGGQYPYLVRGAYLRCQYGSHIRRLNLPESHGFYIKDYPLMNAMDNKPGEGSGNIPPFGVCMAPAGPKGVGTVLLKSEKVNPINKKPYPGKIDDNVKGPPCTATIVGPWQNAHQETLIGEANRTPSEAITTGAFLVCLYSGIIEPLTSGQPEMDRTDLLSNGFDALSDEELLSIDPEDLSYEQRDEFFGAIYKRLDDPNSNLSEDQRQRFNDVLGKMRLEERMGFVYNESGEYGGNQDNPARKFNNDPDFQAFMKNLLPGMTDSEISLYLAGFDDPVDPSKSVLGYDDVGCGYMATANLILTEYANRPDEFKRIFGFPMYTYNADGSRHPNFEKLAISIYHDSGNDGQDGGKPIGTYPKDAIESYLPAHNVNMKVSRKDSFPDIDDIKSDLSNGPIPLSLNPCIMYNSSTGNQEVYGAHAITVTGVTTDGDLIVSSWGTVYSVKQSDYDSINRSDGEYVAYDKSEFK